MSAVKISSMLTDEQMEAVLIIMETYSDDYQTRTRKLKEYLVQFRATLESRGVVPEYLAYAIEFQISKAIEQLDPSRN